MAADRTQSVIAPLPERLKAYGCGTVVTLNQPLNSPEQLDYLDLLPRSGTAAAKTKLLSAVAEDQGTALLYMIEADEEHQVPPADLAKIQQSLANRSDPAWLAVCSPGSLAIYPIGFRTDRIARPIRTIHANSSDAPLFFQSLVHGTFSDGGSSKGADYVSQEIFRLLTQTTRAFVPQRKLAPLDILSMAGRALFFRFLIDRQIIRPEERSEICPAAQSGNLKDVFSSAEKAAQTSAWLDETFNGDFLPLIDDTIPANDRPARYLQFYREVATKTEGKIFAHLHAILNGWHSAGNGHQTELELDWSDFDFAHIPVGVLSQVYENFSHLVDEQSASATSVHYTPRLIADLMVNQTFGATAAAHRADSKVLDPACGAGVFLVLAFRRLVGERWQSDGVRPDTRTIQHILYQQLRGFDLSEAALRLAALSLYITAIELNGTQRPPKALKFPANLRERVLFNVAGTTHQSSGFSLGSLGPRAPVDQDGTFDIVIGNPPWTHLREAEPENATAAEPQPKRSATAAHNDAFTEIGRRVLRARGFTDLAEAYENPDKNPDLPFLWRATEWAKPGGLIAFALPAHIFGRTSGVGFRTWQAILRSIHLTGLINGADLRWSSVWKGTKAPFCLLFARNAVPPKNHRFYFSAPVNDPGPNKLGRFRIDYEATQPISVERIEHQPWILKTLSLGNWRDVEVMESILAAFPQTLEQVWTEWNPSGEKTGQGYNLSPRLKPKLAPWLGTLPDFEVEADGFSIPYDDLKTFRENHGRSSAHKTRTVALYQPPLVIIPQSPGDDRETARAFVSTKPLAFSQSNYGCSCAGHPEAKSLAALLYLLPHSTLFSYFCLMTSRRTGFDRQTFNKEEFDALPFPEVATLSASTKTALQILAHRLEHDVCKPWEEIDTLIFDLYRLDDDARQTIRDTLFSAAAYRRQGREALERTTHTSREPFLRTLQTLLEPYFEVCGKQVVVQEPPTQPDEWEQPWHFVTIARSGEDILVNAALLRRAMQEANRTAASRIVINAPGGKGLLLGLLNQKRWWTISRAHLCGQHLLREHLSVFGLSTAA